MRFQNLFFVSTLACTTLVAQSFTPVREQKNLSPAALATLHTLETLNALPAGDWRFHAGDLAHGESPMLDDSSWETVGVKSKAPEDAVWYRRWIEVPKTLNGYDLTGARIWFQFDAAANGPIPQIIYFNGRRVALGDDLEPIVLFEPAKPGEKILVAVKLLRTVDKKRFNDVKMRIEPSALGSARPNPDDLRVQAIAAANLLPELPTPRKDLLPVVEKAVAAIDLKALAAANQAGFDTSLKKAQTILGALHPELATAKINLTGNAHIDAAWLWPKTETVDVVKRTFTSALQMMNEYPNYTFSQSAAQYYRWMADKYPDLNAQIKQRIKEGRWEVVGGMWVEPDLNLPDGESLVRQLLVGQRYLNKEYGVVARIGWNPDSFGYTWQLPQIYKKSGLDYFVTQKMHWNDTNQLPFRLFWWESPDGSKVLTYFPTDYTHGNVSPVRLSADFAESAQRNPGTTEMMDLYGVGDHGGGPTRAMLDEGDHWIDAGKQPNAAVPTMAYGTAQHFFNDVQGALNPESPTWNYDRIAKGWTAPPAKGSLLGIPTWKDELYFEYHRGIFTTQAAHKRNMRKSEVATLDAEKVASLAWLAGAAYPAKSLTESWEKISFNQFHDLAAGSGIGVIYRDAQDEYTEVFRSDREIVDEATRTLASNVDTRVKAGVPVMVFNSMGWARSETVALAVELPEPGDGVQVFDAANKSLPTQRAEWDGPTHTWKLLVQVNDVPALGYEVLHAEASSGKPKESATLKADDGAGKIVLSNARLSVVIDRKTGCLTSLQTLPAKTEFLAANSCGNQLQTYRDLPKQYDAWNIDPGTLDGTMTPIDAVESVELVDRGPVRETVRVKRTWGQSHFIQDISLDADADMVEVGNDFDWHETHVLLKVALPLAATSAKATYEIPYGAIARTTERKNTWEQAQFEVPAMRWADLGDERQGVSLINESKYGYDAAGNLLRMSLLRSPTWPDAEADRGRQVFRYAIYPHAGAWQQALTVRHGYELNDRMRATQVFAHAGTQPAKASWGEVENANVTLTAVKKAEDDDALVYRMYEWAGKSSEVRLHVPAGASYAVSSTMMEKAEGPHLTMDRDIVTLPIKPFEIVTVQVFYPRQAPAAH
jgi:alpha-mannosidase